jgi:hypothetical protein
MATLSDYTSRRSYLMKKLNVNLRTKTVANDIFRVEQTDSKTIICPYITVSEAQMGAVTGTYTLGSVTTVDETLAVDKQIITAVPLLDHETRFAEFDLAKQAMDEFSSKATIMLDKWALNKAVAGAGQTSAVVTFTKTTSVDTLATLKALVDGYDESFNGNYYLVLESTESAGIEQAGAVAGFTFQDRVINGQKVRTLLGVDIHVVRPSTFVGTVATPVAVGGDNFTNSTRRLFGVRKTATLAVNNGIAYDEIKTSLTTAIEMRSVMYAGFKNWAPRSELTVAVRLS